MRKSSGSEISFISHALNELATISWLPLYLFLGADNSKGIISIYVDLSNPDLARLSQPCATERL